MSPADAKEWVAILMPPLTLLVSLVTAIITQKVHKLVNSAMSQEKAENALLRSMLVAKELEREAAEKTRVLLAAALAERERQMPTPPASGEPPRQGAPGP